MDKIARLRQEIERLKKYYAECGYPGMGEYEQGNKQGRLDTLDNILSFLNTLSEEPYKSLEQAAEEYAFRQYINRCEGEDWSSSKQDFIAGAEWQKSQMLKDAFMDNDVVHDGRIELEGDPLPSLDPILLLPYPQFKPGDKVNVIVLKAEEE